MSILCVVLNHNLISTRYPGGNAGQQSELVTRSYLAQTGQLGSVVSDDGTRFVDYTLYNPAGQMTEQRHDSGANGLTRRVSYDPNTLRTNRIYAGSGNGASTNLQDLSFIYDNNGNIKSLTDALNSGQKQCFGYDWLNRLTGAFTGDASCTAYSATGIGAYNHSYSYNAIGNITSNAGNSYVYGSSKPHAVTAAFGNAYGYDNNGNVASINDTVGGNLSFTYDELDRLKTVSGAASESYGYDPIGNLTSRSSVGNYTYPAYVDGNTGLRQIKHAVSQAGSNTYAYDAVGNMTRRVEGGKAYGQSWDADNRLTGSFEDALGVHTAYDAGGARVRRETYQAGAATFSDAFNSMDAGQWTFNTSRQSLSAGALRSVGNGSDWNGTLYRSVYSLSSGRSATVDFQVDGTGTLAHFAIEASDSERFGVIAQNGALVAQVYLAGQWLYPATVLQNLKLNTWYRLVIRLDDKAGFKAEVRERDGGAGAGEFGYAMTPGKTWRFRHWIWAGVALLDNYAERTDTGSRVTYASDLYEISEPLDTPQTIPTPQPTATPTSMPATPTSTATSVPPTPTPTATNVPPTPTATPAGCTAPGLLDDFNRANGSVGANWIGNASYFAIASNQLKPVIAAADQMYWNGAGSTFGPDQEAFMTLSTVVAGADEYGLALKVQPGGYTNGEIEVYYNSTSGIVKVDTASPSQGWVTRGTIAQTFSSGDVLKAQAKSNGTVEVFRNGALIGTVDVSAWPLNSSGGQIGVALYNIPTTARVDDFGGGTSCGSAGTPTATPASSPTPTATPTSGGGGSNLLMNGGFETGDFTAWDLFGSGQSVVGTNAHSGSYRAKTTSGELRQTLTRSPARRITSRGGCASTASSRQLLGAASACRRWITVGVTWATSF